MFVFLLLLRLLRTRERWVQGAFQDAALAWISSFFPSPLSALLKGIALLDALLWKQAKVRFSPHHLSHFLHPVNFWSSAKTIRPFPEGLLFLASLFVPGEIDIWCFWGGGAFFFPSMTDRSLPNIGWIWAQDLRIKQKQKQSSLKWALPQRELFTPVDPQYPLLRKTRKFLGPCTFESQFLAGDKPHVLFLFLESFRAKEVGALGASPSYSPGFDRLAKEGVLFTQFQAQGTGTSRGAIASLYSVVPPLVSSYLRFFLDIPLIGAPTILREQGYQTGLIQGGHLSLYQTEEFFRRHGFEHLFGKKEIQDRFPDGAASSWGIADECTFEFAADWLAQQKRPTFLSLFTITNHHPWELSSPPCRGFLDTFRYTDECLDRFIQRLDQIGLLDRSLLFILADHGQGLGERDGAALLNRHLYQENVHVPCLIYAKGKIGVARIDEPASQIDLLPTLLDLLSIPAIHHSMGRSLRREGSTPVVMNHPMDDPLVALRKGGEKYILHTLSGEEEFYDLKRDPEEKKRLSLSWREELLERVEEIDWLFREKKFAPPMTERTKNHISFKNNLRIDDQKFIEQLSKNIRSLNLSGALLLSEEGIQKALTQLPCLEELALDGLPPMKLPLGTPKQLLKLQWLDLPEGGAPASWIASLPELKFLDLDASGWLYQDYAALGQSKSQFASLRIDHGTNLDDRALLALLSAQKELNALILHRAPLSSPKTLFGQPLSYLVLEECDCLDPEEWLRLFRALPLQFLAVKNCRGLEQDILELLRRPGLVLNGDLLAAMPERARVVEQNVPGPFAMITETSTDSTPRHEPAQRRVLGADIWDTTCAISARMEQPADSDRKAKS